MESKAARSSYNSGGLPVEGDSVHSRWWSFIVRMLPSPLKWVGMEFIAHDPLAGSWSGPLPRPASSISGMAVRFARRNADHRADDSAVHFDDGRRRPGHLAYGSHLRATVHILVVNNFGTKSRKGGRRTMASRTYVRAEQTGSSHQKTYRARQPVAGIRQRCSPIEDKTRLRNSDLASTASRILGHG